MKAIINQPGHFLHGKTVETGRLKNISHRGLDLGLCYAVTGHYRRQKGEWWVSFESVRLLEGVSAKVGRLNSKTALA